jgi:hypothetical protein
MARDTSFLLTDADDVIAAREEDTLQPASACPPRGAIRGDKRGQRQPTPVGVV